jgi:hypothetical protein
MARPLAAGWSLMCSGFPETLLEGYLSVEEGPWWLDADWLSGWWTGLGAVEGAWRAAEAASIKEIKSS